MNILGNFQGISLETDICIITLDDNLTHTYCHKIKWEKDNKAPIGIAHIIMPYSDEIAKYWTKYSGAVVIHANIGSYQRLTTQAMMANFPNTTSLNAKKIENVTQNKDNKNKIHIKNDEYNYSFIGKVAKFKQTGQTFIVYLEDLGWKFMQKVPKDFRDTYISGQSLDDAFQAICEFMGVDFAYSIEDLNQYKFTSDGYSVEKDGQVIEDVPSILSEWMYKSSENEDDKTEDEIMADSLKNGSGAQLSGLQEYNDRNKTNNQSTTQSTTQTDNQTNQDTENQTSTPIEKMEKYQQEFDEKIKDLFIGNTLYDSNISDPVLNYNWITITPQAATTESTDSNQTNTENTQEENQETNNEVTT